MKNENVPLVSSILKTVASENLVTEAELKIEDKPLGEILNAEKAQETTDKKNTEQS